MVKKHQVLVVDDSDISRKELRHLVRREGLEALQLHEVRVGRLASSSIRVLAPARMPLSMSISPDSVDLVCLRKSETSIPKAFRRCLSL